MSAGSVIIRGIMPTNEAAAEQVSGSSTPEFEVTIENCNSLSTATITLRRQALNIKYGPNGIGKSTIARALELRAQGEDALAELVPFKYREDGGEHAPLVTGADEIEKVLVFDDTYVSQFVFQREEVLKNSFEIFINTEEYQQGLEQIESMFEELRGTFVQEPEFDGALAGFAQLCEVFRITRTGTLSRTSRGSKAISVGGKLANIPEQLQGYEHFLHSEDPGGWISWQSQGTAYLELSDNCPFCSGASLNKETAARVSTEYESAAVKHMSALRVVIDRLGGYIEPSYLDRLNELTTLVADLSPEQQQFLSGLRGQIETLLGKLTALRSLSFHALRDEEHVDEVLADLKIDLSLLDAVNSEATQSVVNLINERLDEVATRINDIRARIGKQKGRVAKLIRDNQNEINEFLASAGYRYTVRIEASGESYRMILEHEDVAGHLETAARHLSYGEKNAFALILFMHHVRRERPDLVVLDDPVSSFDKTKKFAILHQLFHGRDSMREFTTLLLTHDIEPAIDIVKVSTSGQFNGAHPVAHFLKSRGGVVSEKLIERDDIATFAQVCKANIASTADDIIKCIYLRRRYEVHGDMGPVYDVLSSLLHLREVPSAKAQDGTLTPVGAADLTAAIATIAVLIPGFDYATLVAQLSDVATLKSKYEATDIGYEKLQLFRVMSELDPQGLRGDDAFRKFVNESFHIENEYVMQLNPRDYDAVPEFVIEACDELVAGAQPTPA